MDFQELTDSVVKNAPPVLPWAKFADWIQVEPGVVRAWIDRGYLPVTKIGKYTLVNVELFRQQLTGQGE